MKVCQMQKRQSSSKITNYFIIFLSQLRSGKLLIVNYHFYMDLPFFSLSITLCHVTVVTKSWKNYVFLNLDFFKRCQIVCICNVTLLMMLQYSFIFKYFCSNVYCLLLLHVLIENKGSGLGLVFNDTKPVGIVTRVYFYTRVII